MLEVESYLGTKFPSWLSEGLLPNLVKLKLSRCRRCKEIPSLGQLKSLQNLELMGFNELECIGPALYGVEISNIGSSRNIQVFPSLTELVLKDMRSLTEWKGDEVEVRMFPRLEKLRIKNCPLLKSTPSVDFSHAMPKLRELRIDDCVSLEALSDGFGNLVSLEELILQDCEKLEHLPSRDAMRRLTKLWNLEIEGCPKLEESCSNQSGPNSQWSNISHIPNLW